MGLPTTERHIADQMGWLAVSFSVNTLRIETAGLAGCACPADTRQGTGFMSISVEVMKMFVARPVAGML